MNTHQRSVISIRNRQRWYVLGHTTVTLEMVMRELQAKYPTQTFEVHCLFCRNDATGTSPYKNMLTGQAYGT